MISFYKLFKSSLLLTLLSCFLFTNNYSINNKHVVNESPVGLFSCIFRVLNHLAWCNRNNKIPVVFWGERSLYYTPRGYNGRTNVWEYYFEPVSKLSYRPGDKISDRYSAPDGSIINWKCTYEKVKNDFQLTHRLYVKSLINKYIKVRSIVQAKVDNFYNKNMRNRKTIGIHLRGTDNYKETALLPIDKILEEANKYSSEYQFLIATDETRYLERAKEILKNRVIFYPAQRSTDGNPVHYASTVNRAQAGEEALIEALLLARCQKFFHGCSNLSSFVLFFNPYLEHVAF